MALAPVQLISDFTEDYPNFFLKFFQQGTTTPIVMAINKSGSPTVAKAEISAGPTPPLGLIKTAGNVTFIPYVDEAYDAYIFPTEAEADANDTANAIQLADDVSFLQNLPNEVAGTLVADMVANTDLVVGDFVTTVGYTTAGDGGDNSYEVVGSGTGTADGGLLIDLPNTTPATQAKGLFPGGVVSIDQFGADKTGTVDSFTPIQTALNLGIKLATSTGVYLTSESLMWVHGTKLIGKGNWSGVAAKSTNADLGNTVIRYTGAAGGNTAVCILSDEIVGTEPLDSSTRDMQNIGLSHIVIDGNLLAGIGVYMVRAFSNNNLDFITVTGTTAHAFLAMTCFNGAIKSWTASQNSGKGITLGQNVFGWANSVVDQTHFDSLVALFNGFAGVYLNAFDQVTNVVAEYGIGYFGGRGNVFTNAQAFRNGGMGIYLNPQNSPTLFNGGYVEINGNSSGSTQSWDIWFFGDASGDSWDVTFDQMHIGSGGKTRNIRLTGTPPSRLEANLLFKRMQFINSIDADWGNYRLIDCNRNATFTSVVAATATPPNGFVESINASFNMMPVGEATFNAGGATIASLTTQGIISGVVYAGVGLYDVTLSITFPSDTYGIYPATGNNRNIGVETTSITGNSFRLENRDAAGVLTDGNSRVSVWISSAFT